jgi:hypothetical protein
VALPGNPSIAAHLEMENGVYLGPTQTVMAGQLQVADANLAAQTKEKGYAITVEGGGEVGYSSPGSTGGPGGKATGKAGFTYTDKKIDQKTHGQTITGTGTATTTITKGVVQGQVTLVLVSGPWVVRVPLGTADLIHTF